MPYRLQADGRLAAVRLEALVLRAPRRPYALELLEDVSYCGYAAAGCCATGAATTTTGRECRRLLSAAVAALLSSWCSAARGTLTGRCATGIFTRTMGRTATGGGCATTGGCGYCGYSAPVEDVSMYGGRDGCARAREYGPGVRQRLVTAIVGRGDEGNVGQAL